MILLDAKILLYAYNADAPQLAQTRKWLEAAFRCSEGIALAWLTVWAFLRISTNPRLSPRPRPARSRVRDGSEAAGTAEGCPVRTWSAAPGDSREFEHRLPIWRTALEGPDAGCAGNRARRDARLHGSRLRALQTPALDQSARSRECGIGILSKIFSQRCGREAEQFPFALADLSWPIRQLIARFHLIT